MCEKIGRSLFVGEPLFQLFKMVLFIETKNSSLRREVFRKTKKFPTQTFLKAVDRGVKQTDTRGKQAHKSVRGLSMDKPFLKIGLQKVAKLSKASQKK